VGKNCSRGILLTKAFLNGTITVLFYNILTQNGVYNMKQITAALLAFLTIAFCLCSCGKAEEPGKTVEIGEETLVLPSGVTNVTYSAPKSMECLFTGSDGTVYDLFKADRETLVKLSTASHDVKYPALEDKQDIADISASVFSELYPDKGIVYDGAELAVRTNTKAKAIICIGYAKDGGYAALAIDKTTGEIFSILYFELGA